MAGTLTEDYGMSLRPSATDGTLSEQLCQSGDSITEWRSSEQVENGTTSTSPPYWDTDDDDGSGLKPSDLYGRFTWKIENFSTINKRELRSNAFEVGSYKWYILIYPQGCDVCNHLSLFLCVANHDKLLPGWSHFAQFTIAVVNKDPKKSKYSDTLHRFWKKEHDWGWKKFMELSKVYDGFIVADTLVIKAQVQVIREKTERPFRCLDRQYRRELVRVYCLNVEQICRRFIEERIGKLSKFIEDKVRWSSFQAFWLGIDTSSRRRMSRDKTDAILKIVVKHFFIEKEVTSTLVMDSLYSGLKALELKSKNMKGKAKVDLEELGAPIVRVDKDLFVLADDVIPLIERVVSDSLPHQPLPSKDEKCLQNRTKEGSSGDEFNKESIESDERRLMELGRRTIEIFVLVHIFSSRIEVSYQEAIALKRQEELIREEEAGLAENELKSKRGATDKEKRAKKKQAKQKRNNRKVKDKVKDERANQVQEILQQETHFSSEPVELVIKKIEPLEDVSDVSDTMDDVVEIFEPDLDDRDTSPTNWDTDTSEAHLMTEASIIDVLNGHTEKRNQYVMDDSSSTCSTDSVPSALINGSYKGYILPANITLSSPTRGKNHRSRETYDKKGSINCGHNPPSEITHVDSHSHCASGSKVSELESEVIVSSKNEIQLEKDLIEKVHSHCASGSKVSELESEVIVSSKIEIQLEKDLIEKEEVASLQNKLTTVDQVNVERESSSSDLEAKQNSVIQSPKQSSLVSTVKSVANSASNSVEPNSKEARSVSTAQGNKVLAPSRSPPIPVIFSTEAQKHNTPANINCSYPENAISTPSTVRLISAPRSTTAIAPPTIQMPALSRSVSSAGRLGTDHPSPSAPNYVPLSYRNATIGKTTHSKGAGLIDNDASSGKYVAYSQSPSTYLSSSCVFPPQSPGRKDQTSGRPGLTFGCLMPELFHSQHLWRNDSPHESSSSVQDIASNLADDIEKLDIYGKSRKELFTASRIATPYQVQGTMAEFPHLDIINDLLDDEQNVGRTARGPSHAFNRQYSLPGNLATAEFSTVTGSGQFDQSEQYYDEGLLRGNGASSYSLQGLGDGLLDYSPYASNPGQFDGLIRNRWPYGNHDQSMLRLGNRDATRFSFQPLENYLMRGGHGPLFRHANGP